VHIDDGMCTVTSPVFVFLLITSHLGNLPIFLYFYLSCYCAVHVDGVIHFCDSMRSCWVEANLCIFLSFDYICIAVGYPVIKRAGVISTSLTPSNFYACHKPACWF